MIQLNCGAVVAMGLICIPYMQAGDHVVNIASVVAFQPFPYQNIYSSRERGWKSQQMGLTGNKGESGSCERRAVGVFLRTGFDK